MYKHIALIRGYCEDADTTWLILTMPEAVETVKEVEKAAGEFILHMIHSLEEYDGLITIQKKGSPGHEWTDYYSLDSTIVNAFWGTNDSTGGTAWEAMTEAGWDNCVFPTDDSTYIVPQNGDTWLRDNLLKVVSDEWLEERNPDARKRALNKLSAHEKHLLGL
jgi:hypothetical protein